MKIQGDSSEVASNESDFRDELVDYLNKNGQISFGIYVANEKNFVGSKQWMRVGKITFDDVVASDACDHRLHFHDNKFLENVK